MNVLSTFQRIKTFVFDIDGVLTDGSVYVTPENQWVRKMNIKDGYALQLAIKSGYRILVISGSESLPVADRLGRLGVSDVFMKVMDKESFLKEYMLKNKIDQIELLCMGDDIPDYHFMQLACLTCCPADAALEIKRICSYISPFKGGEGCVRDVIEKVLKLNNYWPLETSIASI